MADEELKRLLGVLVDRIDVIASTMATRDDIAAIRAEMATKADIAAVRAEMATKAELADHRQETREGHARLEAMIEQVGQRTAGLIQQDRRDIEQLRGGLDMLGKRFDALVKPAAE
ncbi:hypothetical protein [Azospirillum halopraeferens]|uniref:hypothetical protein n=1 Tax=Azospirillum halopraeferens TaxID=34010 RepID=UPI0004144159|nr:hypothetical protein [Azospirillum halopraeferens]